MSADPTVTVCHGCDGSKKRHHYLCRTCWYQPPADARTALEKTDTRAFRRLAELLDQIRKNIPLGEIEVTP